MNVVLNKIEFVLFPNNSSLSNIKVLWLQYVTISTQFTTKHRLPHNSSPNITAGLNDYVIQRMMQVQQNAPLYREKCKSFSLKCEPRT